MSTSETSSEVAVVPRLGLWDTVSIILGIVIGTAIFRSATMVFQNVRGPGWAMGVWCLGGALAWCGAVCYAELSTAYPRDGGDYEYLKRAFGSWCGFLFGWAQLTTVISGNIAIMAYAFADYGLKLWPAWNDRAIWFVMAPVVVLSAFNVLGVSAGKSVQNLLTAGKVVGLAGLVVAGLWTASANPHMAISADVIPGPRFGLALVFVMYAFGGWSHAAYVAAEVQDQERNLPRALVLGLAAITLIYVAVNATYLVALGFDGVRHTPTPAADVVERALGSWGGRAISLLVMLSALGAINGMILTGTRVYAVWGADYPALAWLGAWNRRTVAPTAAIAMQAAIALMLILCVGTAAGRNLWDAALQSLGFAGLPWQAYNGGFETLVAGSAPVYWGFSLLTGVAVYVLRRRDPSVRRPFRMPLYPLPPLVFCAACGYMLYASVAYAGWLVLLGLVPLAAGTAISLTLRPSNAAE